jgi:hypothetical protein
MDLQGIVVILVIAALILLIPLGAALIYLLRRLKGAGRDMKQSIEMQQKAFQMNEEMLELQRITNVLLREISSKLDRK